MTYALSQHQGSLFTSKGDTFPHDAAAATTAIVASCRFDPCQLRSRCVFLAEMIEVGVASVKFIQQVAFKNSEALPRILRAHNYAKPSSTVGDHMDLSRFKPT